MHVCVLCVAHVRVCRVCVCRLCFVRESGWHFTKISDEKSKEETGLFKLIVRIKLTVVYSNGGREKKRTKMYVNSTKQNFPRKVLVVDQSNLSNII